MYLDSPSPDILAMTTNINLERKNVDLNNCDREPIHIPSLIQPHGVLLVVEDSDEDFAALERAIAKTGILNLLYRCEDGEDALDFLYHEGEYQNQSLFPRPALIILDLNLPGTDGQEVLAALKKDRDLQAIPIIIFSTSSNPRDVDACYRHGVSGYIVKPMNTKRLDRLVHTSLEYWFEVVDLPN